MSNSDYEDKHYDQAGTLRRLMQKRADQSNEAATDEVGLRVISVASGKGGVGKSCLVANLGACLARSGQRVLLVDGDSGLANLDILLGLPSDHRATLEQVLDGRARIQDAIVGVEPNLWLIPSSSGLNDLRQAGPEMRERLARVLADSPWEMDLILLDAGAGIGPNVLSLHSPAFESLIVLTPEPTSLADAYSLMKVLRWNIGIRRFSVVVNQVTDGRQGQAVYQKLKEVAIRFMDVEIDYMGHWQRDEKITQSVMKRKILLDCVEGTPSVACLELLAKRMTSSNALIQPVSQNVQGMHRAPRNTAKFWRTLLGEVKT